MNLPSPAEQLANRKRLKAVFYAPVPKATPKKRPVLLPHGCRLPFLVDPNAPRCSWPKPKRDWILLPQTPIRPAIKHIIGVVCLASNITEKDLISARRTANLLRPRQIAMYLAKTLTLRSLPEIGKRFGGRDHTTVLHAVRKITALRELEPELDRELNELTASIKSWGGE